MLERCCSAKTRISRNNKLTQIIVKTYSGQNEPSNNKYSKYTPKPLQLDSDTQNILETHVDQASPNIVKLYSKLTPNILRTYSKHTQNILQTLSRLTRQVRTYSKYTPNILKILSGQVLIFKIYSKYTPTPL